MNENTENTDKACGEADYNLLRPFDLEAAWRGEAFVFIACGKEEPRKFIAGPDSCGGIVVANDRGEYDISHSYPYKMAPLCWVEGRPVYKGDVLWHKNRGQRVIADRVNEEGYLCEALQRGGDRVENLTWTPPKVKREGWVNIYPKPTEELIASVSHAHASKEKADSLAASGRIACIRIEWEEPNDQEGV